MTDKKICFVIAPIGAEDSDIRRHSDQVLRHIIKPAAEPLGYITTRADEMAEPGTIPTQVIQRLIDDDLVVADLTGHNPNVFYELAIRHAIRKPIVQLIRKGEKIPFDVAQNRTIEFDLQDPDSVADSKNSLVRQIEACERKPDDIDSPISIAVDIQNLRRSDNPVESGYGEILASLHEMRVLLQQQRKPEDLATAEVKRKLAKIIERSNVLAEFLLSNSELYEGVDTEHEQHTKAAIDIIIDISWEASGLGGKIGFDDLHLSISSDLMPF